ARVPRSPSGAPSTRPDPDVGDTSPRSILMEVVFPAPFGPRKPKTSPRPTSRERSSTAVFWPNSFRSPRVSMTESVTRSLGDGLRHLHEVLGGQIALDAEDPISFRPHHDGSPARLTIGHGLRGRRDEKAWLAVHRNLPECARVHRNRDEQGPLPIGGP